MTFFGFHSGLQELPLNVLVGARTLVGVEFLLRFIEQFGEDGEDHVLLKVI